MSIKDLQADQQPIEVQHLQAHMASIESELLEKTPGLGTALATIHKMTQQHEELIHMLDDDDIQKLHAAHEVYKQFKLVQKEVKNVKKSGKKISEADLGNL